MPVSYTHLDVYKRQLYVHSFNYVPPKSWEKVYKVYYSWAIIRQYYEYKDDDSGSKIVHEESDVLLDFGFGCDECSMLPDLAAEIEYVIKTGKTYDHPTFGQPAGEWRIEKHEGNDCTGAHYELSLIHILLIQIFMQRTDIE